MSDSERSRSRSPIGNRNESALEKKDKKRPANRSGRRAPPDRRVYVSNIPYDMKWQDLKDLFRNEVGEVSYVEMFRDEKDQPRGCAIIEFETRDDTLKAIEKMHRYKIKDRNIVVKEDSDNVRDSCGRIVKGGDRIRSLAVPSPLQSLSPATKYGNTYGLSVQFLESLGIHEPLGCRVFVANLDYSVEEDMLRSLFKLAGRVKDLELLKDKEGKSRGFGIVEFDHPVEAVQAISMLHNQEYYERRLSVRMDRDSDKASRDSKPKLPAGLKSIGMGLGADGKPLTDISSIPAAASSFTTGIALNPASSSVAVGGANQLALGGLMGGANAGNAFPPIGGITSLPLGGNTSSSSLLGALGATLAGATIGGSINGSRHNSAMDNSSFGRKFNNSVDMENAKTTIEVTNLPHEFSWQRLRELCQTYGDVRFAGMKGKGVGTVRFQNNAEARMAAEMLHHHRLDGRYLDVNLIN